METKFYLFYDEENEKEFCVEAETSAEAWRYAGMYYDPDTLTLDGFADASYIIDNKLDLF